jgi:hypothetical protein
MYNLNSYHAEFVKRDVLSDAIFQIVTKALQNSNPEKFLAKYSEEAEARCEAVSNEVDSMEVDESIPVEVLHAKIKEERQAKEIQRATEDFIESIVNLTHKMEDLVDVAMIPTEEYNISK